MSSRARFFEGFVAGFRSARLSEQACAAAVVAGGVLAIGVLLP